MWLLYKGNHFSGRKQIGMYKVIRESNVTFSPMTKMKTHMFNNGYLEILFFFSKRKNQLVNAHFIVRIHVDLRAVNIPGEPDFRNTLGLSWGIILCGFILSPLLSSLPGIAWNFLSAVCQVHSFLSADCFSVYSSTCTWLP